MAEWANKYPVVSIFKNVTDFQASEEYPILDTVYQINNGTHRKLIEPLRQLVAEGNTDAYNTAKKRLPSFAPCGIFDGARKADRLKAYSGFVVLDLDKLSSEQVYQIKEKITTSPFTFSCFSSPSGSGLKILIEVNSRQEHHEQAYRQTADYFEQYTGICFDRSGKDITRLCFMSYDPQAYLNVTNEKFPVIIADKVQSHKQRPGKPIVAPTEDEKFVLSFENQISFTDQKSDYGTHNRNNYIYLLASNCNRAGIPEEATLQLCLQRFDLDGKEITASVRSAYHHHIAEFAKFAKFAKSQSEASEDHLKNTPIIPEELYSLMPKIIYEGAKVFQGPRERDVFLTGALSILSGCLPGIKGVYDGQEVFPNLFSFAIAPAASGKGALKFAKMLADVYHTNVVRTSKEAEQQYNKELAEYKAWQQAWKKSHPTVEEPPEKPAFKVIFIPANTSYAKILSHLEQNEGFGIICETEADTMGNVFKQDWGGYSDMLRKAFHHERISSSRKINNEYIEVNDPRLSVALTGTPGQVIGLITSSEDGLFSRFLFYAFKVDQKWKDVSPRAYHVNLTEHFKQLSEQVYGVVQFLLNEETWIDLSDDQWQLLNEKCSLWLNEVVVFTAEEAASIVKRMGLVIYRIAMLFTALRKMENAESTERIICSDNDFRVALGLAKIYIDHSLLMFNNLPKQTEQIHFKGGDVKRKFFDSLPQEFKRDEAIAIASKFNIPERTVGDWLRKMQGPYLSQPKTGYYKKI
ncbi:MAG: DUF3987 domain-containing protein [Chitinophagales bacterium]|nr:DUF3987 domain-containing protein [Chitinophagales bacterium]